MHREHKVILFILVVMVGLAMGYGLARQFKVLRPEELLRREGVKELFYFETAIDLRRLERREFVPQLSLAHVSEGMYSLEVTFPAGGGNLSAWRTFIRNWTDSDIFSFDVHNAEGSPVTLKVIITDEQELSFEDNFILSPGTTNRLEIEIKDVAGAIDVAQVRQLVLEVREPGETTLFFDNMRLEIREGGIIPLVRKGTGTFYRSQNSPVNVPVPYYRAPFPKRTTLTVSKRMARSRAEDICLI